VVGEVLEERGLLFVFVDDGLDIKMTRRMIAMEGG